MTTTATPIEQEQLPFGGTWREYQRELVERAMANDARFARLSAPGMEPHPPEEVDAAWTAAYGAIDAWSLVAVLEWIARTYGERAAWVAAGIAQVTGYDGNPDLIGNAVAGARPHPAPAAVARLLPLVRRLVDAQQDMATRYATAGEDERMEIWTRLHEAGRQLREALAQIDGVAGG
jgi:hypothetical protein